MWSPYIKITLVLLLMIWCIDSKPPEKPPDVRKKMMKLLSKCFTDRLNPVITTPDLHEFFREASWRIGIPPMILIDRNFKSEDGPQHYPRFATFVFSPYSVKSFEEMLLKARGSPWWHKDALFFVIGNLKGGCKPASKILKRSWTMDSLSSVFLCYDEGRGLMLYTYNPYGKRAPHPWIEVEDSNSSNDQWTLYAMRFNKGWTNCASLIFNKATFVNEPKSGNAEKFISETQLSTNREPKVDNVGKRMSSITSKDILQDLLSIVNITAILNDDYLDSDNAGQTGFLSKLINRTYDMLVMIRDLVSKLIGIISLERIFPGSLMPETNVRIISLILFGFLVIIFKHLKAALTLSDSSVTSLNRGLSQRSHRSAVKILLYGLIQLIFILTIVFHRNLSPFLTQFDHSYVNNSKDLETQQCNVYGSFVDRRCLNELEPGALFINSERGPNDSDRSGDSSVMCKRILWQMLKSASKQQPNALKSNIDEILSYLCKDDAPLRKRIDFYGQRLRDAGFEDYLKDSDINFPVQKLSDVGTDSTVPRYRPIQLQDISLACCSLVLGLAMSFVVFMIETSFRLIIVMFMYIRLMINFLRARFARITRAYNPQ